MEEGYEGWIVEFAAVIPNRKGGQLKESIPRRREVIEMETLY